MASRPSSTPGSARGDGSEPTVARVVEFVPRERALAPPANDNARPAGRRLVGRVGPAVALVALVGFALYLALS